VSIGHVVWDWNGTLLDDQQLVVAAANASLAPFGVAPMSEQEYRDHYTRPVQRFYESVLGRTVAAAEWHRIDQTFHATYHELAATAHLTADAMAALELVEAAGWSQSLLSMSAHDRLTVGVAQRGITARFRAVDGLAHPDGSMKAPHLRAHLGRLDVAGTDVVVIGDTPDDAAAAA
jgi:phosphoglycolate phosphatase-like HAD superfamily hydrolase